MAVIENADYVVRLVPLPDGVHGCVSEDADGFCSIYINSKDGYHRQRKAYKHEKKHIENNDFAKSDVVEIEGL
jgi:hypothetical protein